MPNNSTTNPWEWGSFLEDIEPAGYFAYQNQARTPNQKRWFQNQFSNVQNQYMGQLGQMAMSGGEPFSFTKFLSQWFAPQGGAAQQWGSMSPGQRGQTPRQYSPRTRWMV